MNKTQFKKELKEIPAYERLYNQKQLIAEIEDLEKNYNSTWDELRKNDVFRIVRFVGGKYAIAEGSGF